MSFPTRGGRPRRGAGPSKAKFEIGDGPGGAGASGTRPEEAAIVRNGPRWGGRPRICALIWKFRARRALRAGISILDESGK